ncbi:MAG: AAA family ATPase, partial [Anaerolineae bacterium]|nr:AAA family ATPase [Anaerolineae bacterium]
MDDSKTLEFVAPAILCPTLIGRDAQREALAQLLAQAADGQGQIGLISGEAGIGKSRLVAEAKTLAPGQGFTILQGMCYEQDQGLPFAPWLDLLHHVGDGQTLPELAQQLYPYAPDLIKLLPELSPYWPDIPLPVTTDEPEQDKRQLFLALERFFADFQNPLLLVIEDLHWCDDISLEVLLYLARRIATRPILLLLTYRNDEVHPALSQFLATLDRTRRTVEIGLPRLTRDDLDVMIRAIFKQSRPVRREFVEAMHALTDGNPFFVEETLKAMVTAGDIYFDVDMWTRKPLNEIQIPRTVQDSVQRRTETLSDAARRLLTLAAVAGRRFNFDLLERLSEQSEQQLLTLIKELIAAQLVIEERADSFVFRHALTQRAIYAGLLARERRKLHRRIAEVLEEIYPISEPDIDSPAESRASPRTRA